VNWRDLPGPARAVGSAVTKAVTAAVAADRAEYEPAAAELADPATGIVLSSMTRTLLESQHPDGLDSDDIAKVLGRCYQSTVAWLPEVDVAVLLAVLASALGIHEPGLTYDEIGPPPPGRDSDEWRDPTDEVPHHAPTPVEYAHHAPLLIADLLAAGRMRLNPVLDAAFAEIAEAESMEMP
jgi:hypothetical protein